MANQPPSNKLKRQVQAHYLQQHLSEQQLDKLQHLSGISSPAYLKAFASIAACVFFATAFYIYSFSQRDYSIISKDIAYNHNSKLQMEVLSPKLQTVQGHLNKLGFTLVSSNKVDKKKWKLIGGRYCNINGKIAAQMKLRHNDTKAIYTFYQAKLPSDLVNSDFINNEKLDEVAIDGVNVKLWKEKGLLMGLAF